MTFKGKIRELEYWDYTWTVEAKSEEEAKEKILNGDGIFNGDEFIGGSEDYDREEAIHSLRLVK